MTTENTDVSDLLGDGACFLSTSISLSCLSNKMHGFELSTWAASCRLFPAPTVVTGLSSSQREDSESDMCHLGLFTPLAPFPPSTGWNANEKAGAEAGTLDSEVKVTCWERQGHPAVLSSSGLFYERKGNV